MTTETWEVLLLFAIGAVPVLMLPLSRRVSAWLLLGLVPLHQYHKSFFLTVDLGGQSLQWPTLAKDVAWALLFAACLLEWMLSDSQRAWRWTWRLSLIVGLLAGLSLAAGSGGGQTVMGLRLYAFWPAVGILIGRILLHSPRDVERLVRVLGVGCGVIGLVALTQALVSHNFLIHSAMRQLWAGSVVEWFTYRERLRGPFTSANTLGLFMTLGTLSWVGLATRPFPSGRDIVTSWILVPICVAVMFLTESRTALVGCVIGLFALGARRDAGAVRRSVIVLGLATGVLASFTVGLDARFVNLLSNPRLIYWAAFLSTVVASPQSILMGQGLGSTGRYGVQTQTSVESAADLSGVIGGEGLFFVDSVYIRAVFELGFVGLIPLFWLTHRALRLTRSPGEDAERRWAANLAGCILIFLLFASLLTEALITYPWNVIAWALATTSTLRSQQDARRASDASWVPVAPQRANS